MWGVQAFVMGRVVSVVGWLMLGNYRKLSKLIKTNDYQPPVIKTLGLVKMPIGAFAFIF